ncbi:MAG: peptidase M22 [Clostridia bacterium]|nr:peptidase M22 [Clostridia bacterium]MDR3645567.1 peptidase M22 [Clostridia bacterium]
MSCYLGIDTSNYTTSAALLGEGGLRQQRRLLEVPLGGRGLRQSEAVFQHVKALPGLLERLTGVDTVMAVGASVRPRDEEGSYMPCFCAGECAARAVAAARTATFYAFSHQAGHIAAALYSVGRLELLHERFIAFHVSGGTTEAVLVSPSPETVIETQVVASSLDLKAGQAIDRTGVMLGLRFPCGPLLEELAAKSEKRFKSVIPFRGMDFSLSGIENHCRAMFERGEPHEDIAAFCIASVQSALRKSACMLLERYPGLQIVFAGGVTANAAIRCALQEEFGALFARPELSGDNAAGIAVLTKIKVEGI